VGWGWSMNERRIPPKNEENPPLDVDVDVDCGEFEEEVEEDGCAGLAATAVDKVLSPPRFSPGNVGFEWFGGVVRPA